MPILTLQRRVRELGRIRIGEVTTASNGKKRPSKLDRFRLTSASKELLEKVAALYGGTVAEWTPANGGPAAWEVVTTSNRLPILIPPQPVSQYFELWSGGGCQRRCDGVTELLSDKACVCSPDPEDRECKPTTRLNVVLRDVEGIGVWRLESHGYYAAVELPEVAEFLARAGGYLSAWLSLEERVVKRNNQTRRFMVPALEVDITPAALLAGGGHAAAALTAGTPPGPAAIEPSKVTQDPASMLAAIAAAATVDDLHGIWEDAKKSGATMTAELKQAFAERGSELANPRPNPDADVVVAEFVDEDADALWQKVLAAVPDGWTTGDVEAHFSETTGVDPGVATAADMDRYLRRPVP